MLRALYEFLFAPRTHRHGVLAAGVWAGDVDLAGLTGVEAPELLLLYPATFLLPEGHTQLRRGTRRAETSVELRLLPGPWESRRPGQGRPGQARPGQGRAKSRGGTEKGHSLCIRAGPVEEAEGDRAGHLGPHLPRAAERVGPVKDTLQVLGLGLVPCSGDSLGSPPPSLHSSGDTLRRPPQGAHGLRDNEARR